MRRVGRRKPTGVTQNENLIKKEKVCLPHVGRLFGSLSLPGLNASESSVRSLIHITISSRPASLPLPNAAACPSPFFLNRPRSSFATTGHSPLLSFPYPSNKLTMVDWQSEAEIIKDTGTSIHLNSAVRSASRRPKCHPSVTSSYPRYC